MQYIVEYKEKNKNEKMYIPIDCDMSKECILRELENKLKIFIKWLDTFSSNATYFEYVENNCVDLCGSIVELEHFVWIDYDNHCRNYSLPEIYSLDDFFDSLKRKNSLRKLFSLPRISNETKRTADSGYREYS